MGFSIAFVHIVYQYSLLYIVVLINYIIFYVLKWNFYQIASERLFLYFQFYLDILFDTVFSVWVSYQKTLIKLHTEMEF